MKELVMIKLDIMSWEQKDIDMLSNHYNIPKKYSKKQRIDLIARHIYDEYIRSTNMDMTPEEEERLIAEQSQRRKQMQLQQERWKSLPLTIDTQQDDKAGHEDTKNCYSDIDFFTQDTFLKSDLPLLHIQYIDSSLDMNKPKSDCYNKTSFLEYLNDDYNVYRQWVREFDPLPELKKLEPDRSFEMNAEGYNGTPSIAREIYKLPDRSAYIIMPDAITEQHNNYYAFLIAKQMRIGNPEGTFYESQTHGQLPGYNVYFLIPTEYKPQIMNILIDFILDELESINFDSYILSLPKHIQQQFIIFISKHPDVLVSLKNSISQPIIDSNSIYELDDDVIHHVVMQLVQESFYPSLSSLFVDFIQSLDNLQDNLDDVLVCLQTIFTIEENIDIEERETRTVKYIQQLMSIKQPEEGSRPLVSYQDILGESSDSPEYNNRNEVSMDIETNTNTIDTNILEPSSLQRESRRIVNIDDTEDTFNTSVSNQESIDSSQTLQDLEDLLTNIETISHQIDGNLQNIGETLSTSIDQEETSETSTSTPSSVIF
jgi:hypothetical protein